MPDTEPVKRFLKTLQASLADGTFVRLVLSGTEPAEDAPEKVLARCVELKGVPQLSLTFRQATRDVTKNLGLEDGIQWVCERLGREFRNAWLGTTARDWQLVLSQSGRPRLVSHKPAATEAPPRAHDRIRSTILDESARDWLQGLGVVDAAGQVRGALADKHRQINRYLEILSHLAQDCGWMTPSPDGRAPRVPEIHRQNEDGDSRSSPLREQGELVLADMGCGKGYLTFGAWHLFRRIWKKSARVIGVEARVDLVAATNELARRIKADGLEFVSGTIESARLPGVDALIALHACDTATDDAIRRGIELGATLIVVAPCCHKELRPQLGKPGPFASVLRHGLMEERMAEWLTDGLRALFLEWAGYRTKVFEFVASEHTPKNLMIVAVRHGAPFADNAARKRIEDLKAFFSIRYHALDSLLERTADERR